MSEKRRYSYFPKTLAQVIEPLTRPLFKAKGLAGTRLLSEWAEIVGPELARRSAPEKVSFPPGKTTGGTLTIAVENGFSTEMQYHGPIILERLAIYYGYAAISRIAIGMNRLPAAAPPPQPSPRPVVACSVSDSDVADEDLKIALKSLAKTLSGQAT